MKGQFLTVWFVTLMAVILSGCRLAEGPRVTILADQGSVDIQVEVVSSEAEKDQGLMGRDFLADGKGMLFVFGPEERPVMWMKNMLIPLDLVFISKDLTINHIIPQIRPCKSSNDSDCLRYGSKTASAFVLELPAGYTQKKGINRGDQVELLGVRGL